MPSCVEATLHEYIDYTYPMFEVLLALRIDRISGIVREMQGDAGFAESCNPKVVAGGRTRDVVRRTAVLADLQETIGRI